MSENWWGKLMTAMVAGVYGLLYMATFREWHFIDYVTLIVHEAGHPLFSFFGDTISALGGTIAQLAFPLAFIWYFFFSGQKFSAAIISYWLGFSLINVGIYAGDARVQALPLIGGEHDWAFLFSQWHLLDRAEGIGTMIIDSGFVVILLSLFSSMYMLYRDRADAIHEGVL